MEEDWEGPSIKSRKANFCLFQCHDNSLLIVITYQKIIQKKYLNLNIDSLPHTINTIDQNKLPYPKTELVAASILANMNRINHSPCSEEADSITSSSGNEAHTANIVKSELRSIDEITDEPLEQVFYFFCALSFCLFSV